MSYDTWMREVLDALGYFKGHELPCHELRRKIESQWLMKATPKEAVRHILCPDIITPPAQDVGTMGETTGETISPSMMMEAPIASPAATTNSLPTTSRKKK
jgi:hypothetical protein